MEHNEEHRYLLIITRY